LPEISIAGKLPNSPVRLGLTAVMPGGYGAEYTLTHSVLGHSQYRSAGALLKILPSIAIPLNDRVSIGGGVGLAYGSTELRMPYTFQVTPGLVGGFGQVDLKADGFGVTWNAGIQVRATDRLTIGVAYISETMLEQDGDFKVTTPLISPGTANYDADVNLSWPRSFALGANYRFDFGRLSFDAVWYDWSDAFDKLRFHLSKSDNPAFDVAAGTEPYDEFPLNWDDSVSLRLGYEQFFCEGRTVLRFGYTWNLNPIPDGTATPLLPGTLEHTATIGLGHDFGPIKLDFAYQWAIADTVTVGTSDILGPGGSKTTSDFNNSELRAQAHWFFVTMMAKF
jgi:long-chain fatty acid transport protein